VTALLATTANPVLGLIIFGLAFTTFVATYFIPSMIASYNRAPNTVGIMLINFFLGWTVIGWVVALAMACRPIPPPHGGEPPPISQE